MKKKLISAVFAATIATALASAPAHAATFVFKGDGNTVTPIGIAGTDFQADCASTGDFCSINHDAGLNYTLDGIDLTVKALAEGAATRVIQDFFPWDSGLGAFSEDNNSDDQTQADSDEALEFSFTEEVTITDVEFNAGGDTNCTNTADGSGEGACGAFLLEIFGLDGAMLASTIIDITNTDDLPLLGTGARFLLTALTPGGGFTVAQFTVAVPVAETPLPGAIGLLFSGIAGLGFASRGKKPSRQL